jgi:Bacterial Ig domain/Glycosyl hydrolases family 16
MTQSLQITAPANGAVVQGQLNVSVTAVEVGQVNFAVDGKFAGYDSSSPFSFSLDTTRLPDGAHTIKAVSANGAVSSSVSVTVENAAPAPTPSPTPTPTPSPVSLGAVIFEDHFNGPAGAKPDTVNKWNAHSGHAGLGLGYWNGLNNMALDGNGNLIITANKISSSLWNSGFLTSKPGWTGKRFLETRAKCAPGVGTWNGPWWEWSWPWGSSGYEIDVVEQLGREPEVNHTTLHHPPSQKGNPDQLGVVAANDFHLYAAAIYPDHIDFFFDNRKVWSVKGADVGLADLTKEKMSGCVQLNMGGWGGTPTVPGPCKLVVDYVRTSAIA